MNPRLPNAPLPLLLLLLATAAGRADEPVEFSRQVLPILTKSCYVCHGPDEGTRETELRLDSAAGATADLGGYQAVVPGKPEESELVRRVFSSDPDERMPPADSELTLSDAERDILRRWIAEGGQYEEHWAFAPPRRPALPPVGDPGWVQNAIDHFVLARLEREGLNPAPPADRLTLVRRLYLDLIGLPPTPAEADAFLADTRPDAYLRLVDALLASPHYGERWARPWLDLARYADTNGYEKDRPRTMWLYRDWVIEALNADMPFDRFTIEQLAGDMLPGARVPQRIATGFHRNTMLNEEGGIDPLEYRFYAMVDRVATTGTVWMGLTTGCAQCHSHKFDPISHTDYYRLFALLNNADEPDLVVHAADVEQQRREIENRISQAEARLPVEFPPDDGPGDDQQRRRRHFQDKFAAWLADARRQAVDWQVLRPSEMQTNLPRLELLDDGSIFSSGDVTKRDVFTLKFALPQLAGPLTALRLEVLPDERLPAGGPGRAYYEGRKGDFFLSEVTARADGTPLAFAGASHSYGKISIGSGTADAANVIDGEGSTGWSTSGREGEPHQLVLNLAQPLAAAGELQVELLFERHFAASLGRFRLSATAAAGAVQATQLPVDVERLLTADPDSWTADQRQRVERHFLRVAPELAEARKRIDALRNQLPEFPTAMVMLERTADNPRPTFRHHRGEYLQAREEVSGGVPEIFPQLATDAGADRLALARWLVSRDNPLVGRVTVNRAWRAFFGHGLVRSNGDFGTRSTPPTHPQLLDWLACEFMEGAAHGDAADSSAWSLKQLHRLIVTSATYQQSSRITPALLQRDPDNRLLARGPRFRIDAEMIRDVMLHASGLLADRLGGPSVFPPQPASVTALAYGGFHWKPTDPYRRSLYTFAKRTSPFAAYTVFDAPTGESCLARRDRSNTPLQALTLLNDELYLELARALARRTLNELPALEDADGGGERDDALSRRRAASIFRRLLTRLPQDEERNALLAFQRGQAARLQAGELDAAAIGGEGANAELASWVMVARAVMNLDEAITKP